MSAKSELILLSIRYFTSIIAFAFLLNGGYEYLEMQNSSEAAVNIALASIFITCYLDATKQDRRFRRRDS